VAMSCLHLERQKPVPKFSLLRGDQGSPARWVFGGSWQLADTVGAAGRWSQLLPDELRWGKFEFLGE
jgi:hypothetical protein